MKLFLTLSMGLFYAVSFSQTVDIPDKNFERVLIEQGIDSDKTINGKVFLSDVQSVTFLNLYNKKIKSLKGIEAFTSLSFLDCRNNHLSDLDLSNNIAINILHCDTNNSYLAASNATSLNWFDL